MKPHKDPATGHYQVRWRVKCGSVVRRPKRTFKTRREAVAFIENLATERNRDANAARRTFNDYADRYLAAAQSRCKQRTVDFYAQGLRHARAFLGDRLVGTLRASDADAYLAYLDQQSPGCRVGSIRSAWRTFAAVLDMAVRDEALPSNPAHKVDLPTANGRGERRFQAAFLSSDQIEALAVELVAPYDLLLRFASYTGLRRGEIAGLDLRHLTLVQSTAGWRGRVRVERTARFGGGGWTFDTPKTERSNRDVPLPGWLAEAMHDYVHAHPNGSDPDAALWPGRRRGGVGHGRVSYDQRWEPESFCRNVFTFAVARAGLGRVRFHDLRHTFASLCSAAGVPVERVSAWLGHSSIVITWTTYTHLFRGDEDHLAVEALERPTFHLTRSDQAGG